MGPLLNVIVSGSGSVDLRLPVFTSGKVPALIITTSAGDRRLSLVMGKVFAPGAPLWVTMIDARRGSSHLFLR